MRLTNPPRQERSAAILSLLGRDDEPAAWWASPVECQSAIYRRRRAGDLSATVVGQALRRLAALMEDMDTVTATDAVRNRAGQLLARHPLRATDALQLAAALAWCAGDTGGRPFVCLDRRLREAAGREGFEIRPA